MWVEILGENLPDGVLRFGDYNVSLVDSSHRSGLHEVLLTASSQTRGRGLRKREAHFIASLPYQKDNLLSSRIMVRQATRQTSYMNWRRCQADYRPQTIGGIVSKETVCCVGGKVKH